MNLVVKTLQPLEASFGSKLYGDSKEENNSLFAGYDMFCQILASMFFVVFIVLFQPGITLLYGKEYLLPFPMVCAVAANNYIAVRQYAITAYRNALGKYNLDRNYRIASAVLNVLLSIALGKIFGVTGIIVSTAIGHLFIWMGRVKVVCAEYFCDSSYKKALCLQELVSLVKNTILAAACLAICNPLPVTVLGVLLRALVCTLLPTVVDVLIYRKDARFQAMRLYVRRILGRKRTQAPV
jgi:O-antigen/teichoic acid export membrane protein